MTRESTRMLLTRIARVARDSFWNVVAVVRLDSIGNLKLILH